MDVYESIVDRLYCFNTGNREPTIEGVVVVLAYRQALLVFSLMNINVSGKRTERSTPT